MPETTTPKSAGYLQPPEWALHDAVWLAWPSAEDLWQDSLKAAQDEFVAFAAAIADVDPITGKARGERLEILVPTADAGQVAERRLSHLPARFHLIPFGDIWLRDTAPIFLKGPEGLAAARFRFNGWGGKYELPHDAEVARRIVEDGGFRDFELPWVLEGGSVEVDGEGLCLTSRQCLLNPNRNPSWDQKRVETELCAALGVETVLWVGDGLINDHTDGHIDTIARFVAPGTVLCMRPQSPDDPNTGVLETIAADLEAMTDRRGRPLKIGYVPSPGAVVNEDGDLMPASYLNFYIANSTVVVPVYGSDQDAEAVSVISRWFPTRRTIGLSAKAILTGGGAFHCISQQQPK